MKIKDNENKTIAAHAIKNVLVLFFNTVFSFIASPPYPINSCNQTEGNPKKRIENL